ncbi:MAG TPA: SGNH/GDSL hydrolase family protein [Mobilitalea sp.]|nr:SGNH/GDSL hydrolase family protein [Mobilitalea sp.]
MKKRFGLILTLIAVIFMNFAACNNNNKEANDLLSTPSPQPQLVTIDAPQKEADTAKNSDNNSDDMKGNGAADPTLTPALVEADEDIFNRKDEEYITMIENSLISTGNNYRVKKAIEKAQKGEKVTIAYIGGSITEGAGATTSEGCYAYQSYLYFKDTFGSGDGGNVKFVNTGMGGTPSTLGIIRYDRDVTDYGQVQPDIVFIEFAVNDYQEPTNGEAYESLIRKVLSAENQPAVILLFSVFKSRWNMQDLYKPIGSAYNLPMISIKDAVVPELEAGQITDSEFFIDDYHPTDFGHGIMADCVKYYYSTVNAEPTAVKDITVPKAAYLGKSFEGIKMIDSKTVDENVFITPGSFIQNDDQLCKFATKQLTFPNNWKHGSLSGSDSFVMKLNCRNLLFVYKSCSDEAFGTADIYVDGKLATNLVSSQSGGWNNPVPVLLLKEDKAADHTVEITMAEGNEDKEFTILAFGYTQ